MFSKATLHALRPSATFALLAAVTIGLAATLSLLGSPEQVAASHGSPGDAPGKVTGVTISEDQETPGSITIAWDATTPGGAPITDYILFVVNVADETDYRTGAVTTSGPDPSAGELEYDISDLREGATYDVRVRARNLIGERGPWSDTVQVTVAGS